MFKVLKTFNRCRAAEMTLRHGQVRTPVYMPVGTKGAMKGLLPTTMAEEIDCDIMLANTYHLFLKPGEETLTQFKGLHKYADWPRCFLTDSGGFQIVSLDALNKIDEEGVTFKSHIDGREFMLSPERSMEI
jgi:queuine tRNA-ribosyltransferase